MSTSTNENVGIALGLVLAAGASTALGAAVVFIPSLVKLASRRVLAGSLGFSAGVMTYVSFVEIFGKARTSFVDAGHEENKAYIYATLCFFGGVLTMIALTKIVAILLGGHSHRTHDSDTKTRTKRSTRETVDAKVKEDTGAPHCCARDPVEQLDTFQRMASVLQHERVGDIGDAVTDGVTTAQSVMGGQGRSDEKDEPLVVEDFVDNLPLDLECDYDGNHSQCEGLDAKIPAQDSASNEGATGVGKKMDEDETHHDNHENKKLAKMGLNTALAIGLHNFPEGLATFVAALEDPKVGAVLAVAIAVHNVPEGLCVALPIYYATGNRLKAFMWALLSGASEFIAALLGWAILASAFSPTAYAVLFGLVAGMMVIISIRELLPTAHFYDPEDTVVTTCFICGMGLMALSLVLFQI